ncbi:MAG TPA: FAD-dependent oxidoreductase, partial [Solirubrobacteraceae bacterium]|nr:FAD-dependent oxidoreductase [Solirubrobacteraceae bacterium]
LLLERREQLGGAAVSESPFAGVDARISAYSYLVSLMPQTIVRELGLDLRLARRTISSYTPDPRVAAERGLLVDGGDEQRTRASFYGVSGSEEAYEAWTKLYAMTERVARAVFPTLIEPLRPAAEMRRLVADDEAWDALFERPIGELVDGAFSDDLIAGVVLTDALIGTFAAAHDADLRQNRCFLYHVIGGGTGRWDVPIGGMGAVSGALAKAAAAAGTTLRTGVEVKALGADSGGVDVTCSDGASEFEVRAGTVLVGAAPEQLARLIGGGDQTGPRPEGAQLKLNLMLERLPRLRDGTDPRDAFAGTFHVNETASQLQQAHAEADRGEIPRLPPCESYCHSLSDPSILGAELRESGAQTLTVFGLHMPARLFETDHDKARAAALESTLRSIDSVLAEPIESCLLRRPDGEPCMDVRTPLDIERSLNMPRGNIFHRDLSWPFAEQDEEAGLWGVETDEPRILLCGAGARRGGGVSGVPGRNAAMALLERSER